MAPQLVEIGLILYQALGIDLKPIDIERIGRVTTAFCGLSIAAMRAVRADMKRMAAPYRAVCHGRARARIALNPPRRTS